MQRLEMGDVVLIDLPGQCVVEAMDVRNQPRLTTR
jgi:hypothetical protein